MGPDSTVPVSSVWIWSPTFPRTSLTARWRELAFQEIRGWMPFLDVGVVPLCGTLSYFYIVMSGWVQREPCENLHQGCNVSKGSPGRFLLKPRRMSVNCLQYDMLWGVSMLSHIYIRFVKTRDWAMFGTWLRCFLLSLTVPQKNFYSLHMDSKQQFGWKWLQIKANSRVGAKTNLLKWKNWLS